MKRGERITDAQEERLFKLMRDARSMEEFAYRSLSGADVSGAPIHTITYQFWVMVWEGKDIEDALNECRKRWVAYCAENNAKVEAAPKISRGPMQGASWIHHRWTSPERFDATAVHLRQMVRIVFGGRTP